ncbi:TPA: hypothetical protein R1707_001678, partial [Campylobacter lari]|nr:hypothetical protein [Campylobacter lari]
EFKRFINDLEKKDDNTIKTIKQKGIQDNSKVAKNTDQNNTQSKDINTDQINSNDKDGNKSFNQDTNTSKETMDMILKTMEKTQMQMLAPSKEQQDLFNEIPF